MQSTDWIMQKTMQQDLICSNLIFGGQVCAASSCIKRRKVSKIQAGAAGAFEGVASLTHIRNVPTSSRNIPPSPLTVETTGGPGNPILHSATHFSYSYTVV